MAVANYKSEIARSSEILKKFRKSNLFNQEKEILELMQQRYGLYYSQIHEYLAPKKTEQSEQEIQDLVKEIFVLDLPVCEAKIKRFRDAIEIYQKRKDENNVNKCYKYLQDWLQLYEDDYALVAFRSLEHWALFSEWDKPEQDKFWKYSIDTFGDNGYSGCTKGFFYYGNQMILGNKIKFMLKRMPTSYGKSFSDSVMISFIFGKDRNEQVIKVVGNRSLPPKCTKQVVDLMCSKRFRQVFPEYAKYVDESKPDIASQIFSTCSIKDGVLTIKDCGRDTSYESFSKETKRDGIRGGWLFLDDIVQRKEIMKLKAHEEDLNDFDGTWKKRSRDEKTFRIVCGGTSYDCGDLLQVLLYRYSKGKMKKSPINKWTTLSMDEDAVFVTVKKLDENDQLTFPQKTVLSSVLADRQNNPSLFLAMDMQEPVAPEDTPFYWDYIRQYEYIPSESSEYCYATLDPARTGDNYIAMPIFKVVKEIDKDGNNMERHYLIDCLYMKCPMDTIYGFICELIEKHHIIKLHIERNTDTSLKFLLDKLLKERDISFCEITEVYSTKKKEDRIYANETAIKNKIVFPRRELYSLASQMGQFMQHITAYKYTGSDYDDSIDAVGLYVDKFINDSGKKTKLRLLYV